jgi:uncharacterized protein (DUF2384 family)
MLPLTPMQAIGFARLLAQAQEIVADSTAPEAASFDTTAWLEDWIQRPQPALGGRKPIELLDSEEGVEAVARVLGACASGSYQ